MKIEINLTMESKDPEVIPEMLELANYIKSGGLQRDMSKDSPMARFKRLRVKATVNTIPALTDIKNR